MKLSLISEMDAELRRWSRRAKETGDVEDLARALRAHQRARGGRSEWQEPSVEKNIDKLKPHGKNWSQRDLLPLVMFSISWEGNLTREEALAAGLKEIVDQGYQVGDWDIFQEETGENGGWMVLTIEVSEDFVAQLADDHFIEFYSYPDNGRVTVGAEWV
jgi:hypothetical protein